VQDQESLAVQEATEVVAEVPHQAQEQVALAVLA
jgi:hypothetical protein